MEKPRMDLMLEDCLDQVAAGESAAECLVACGNQAAAIEPLVFAAERLQRVRSQHLSDAQRQKAHAILAAAMRERNRRAADARPAKLPSAWPWGWQPRFNVGFAVVLAVALVAAMAFTVVASQPGGITYPLRVGVERLSVMLANSAQGRVAGEMKLADRRLADLESYFRSTGRVEPAALAALLAGDERAADEADMLNAQERVEVQGRITTHSRVLAALAAAMPDPQSAAPLQEAVRVTSQIATRLAGGANGPTLPQGPHDPAGTGPAGGSAHTPTRAATASPRNGVPTRTATAARTPSDHHPTVSDCHTRTPRHAVGTGEVRPGRDRDSRAGPAPDRPGPDAIRCRHSWPRRNGGARGHHTHARRAGHCPRRDGDSAGTGRCANRGAAR